MTRATSLYLDILRFLAALAVFFFHYCERWISDGLFWQVGGHGHSAVIVFFVLSGYVIAYSAATKDRTARDYALSRLSRLLSVSVPALALTAVLYVVGGAVNPSLYAENVDGGHWPLEEGQGVLALLAGLTFTSEIWAAHIKVLSNGPYWSLSYEFWYYVIFGAAFYCRGAKRWLLTGLACLIAGPKILFLFPLWLLGAALWRWGALLPERFAWPLLLASAAALAGLQLAGGRELFTMREGPYWPMHYSLYDHVLAVIVAAHVLAVGRIPRMPLIERCAGPIRAAAGFTFSLYLFHMPLLTFLAAVLPGETSAPWRQGIILVGTLTACVLLGLVTEHRKDTARRLLLAIAAVRLVRVART